MPDRDGPRSNPYHPNPEKCCEACVFGSGKHTCWLTWRQRHGCTCNAPEGERHELHCARLARIVAQSKGKPTVTPEEIRAFCDEEKARFASVMDEWYACVCHRCGESHRYVTDRCADGLERPALFGKPESPPRRRACCEACTFGEGEHAAWCDQRRGWLKEVLEDARREVNSWPAWMRR